MEGGSIRSQFFHVLIELHEIKEGCLVYHFSARIPPHLLGGN